MAVLPTGTVTFLFTDIEGSTQLWEENPRDMAVALSRHDELLRRVIEENGGVVFKTVGDAFCAAFQTAEPAVNAALETQRCLLRLGGLIPDSPPLFKVRMALHAGEPVLRDGDFYGPAVNRVARILATAHGGQILISAAVAELIQDVLAPDISLVDHGAHRLKDLTTPETLYQLAHPDLPAEFPPLRSLSSHPNNLPAEITAFIGREAEMEAVQALLDGGARLLTLTGEGGIGKTRIALQVAAERIERYPGGVWWLELSAIHDPAVVMPALANALNLPEEGGAPALQQVANRLRDEKALLVLDNFEHVTPAAQDIADLLRLCPQLSALITSRAVLNLTLEHEYAVPEMSLPEATSLFVARAQQVRARFNLDDQTRPAVEALCRKLDGIPLALELAAAQVRLLPISHIEKQLSQRFRLLVSPFRDVSQRQRTLRAAIDWSYTLLSEEERELFARLSVFVGGFTVESAEAVCDREDVFYGIARLREQSLLRAEETDELPRFRMLATLREYGLEKLEEGGELDAVAGRHARYYAEMARREGEILRGSDRETAMAALSAEADNLRAALEWLNERGSADEEAAMAIGLAHFWEGRGWLREGLYALIRALGRRDQIEDARRRARLLNRAGWFDYRRGEYESARRHQEEGLAIAREIGDAEEEANALNDLALTAQAYGDLSRAQDLFEGSLAIVRSLDDQPRQAVRLGNLGLLAIQLGRHEEARHRLEEAHAICARCKDSYGTAVCLCNLAELALRRQDWGEASRLSDNALQLFRKLDDRSGVAYSLVNLSEATLHHQDCERVRRLTGEALEICLETGEHRLVPTLLDLMARSESTVGSPRRAAYLLAGADMLRASLQVPRSPQEQQEIDDIRLALCAVLGEEEMARQCASVNGLTVEDFTRSAESIS